MRGRYYGKNGACPQRDCYRRPRLCAYMIERRQASIDQWGRILRFLFAQRLKNVSVSAP